MRLAEAIIYRVGDALVGSNEQVNEHLRCFFVQNVRDTMIKGGGLQNVKSWSFA